MGAAVGTANALEFDPDWCLFWAQAVAGFQLDIWIPYLRRSRFRYAIIAGEDRFPESVRQRVAELPNCVILEPFDAAKAALRRSKNLRGFLYVGTKQENFRVVNSFGGKLHVWLGHGESEKLYSAFRTASLYDSVFMARYAAVKRYPRAIRRWVAGGACAIGTPIVEGLVKDPWERPRQIRTILYAPTWEGGSENADYASLPHVGPMILEALPGLADRGITVIMRLHPATGRRRPELKGLRDALFAAGVRPAGDKAADFAAADLIISDISGITAEFLFTEKPIVMAAWDQLAAIGKDDTRLGEEYPFAYRWHVPDEDLLERIDALQASDPLGPRRAAAARTMFRGHRSLEEAVLSFDAALSSVRWRKTPVPVRWVYETKRRIARLRPRRQRTAAPGSAPG